MTKRKKRQIFIMTMITLVICSVLLWNMLEKQEYTLLENNNSSKASSNVLVINKKDVVDFIYNYSLNTISTNKQKYEDMTNQDKLVLIVKYLLKQGNVDFNDGVEQSIIETYIHYVFGVEAEIIHENINYNGVIINYDKDDNRYYYNGLLEYEEPNVILEKTTNYKNSNQEYSIVLKLVYEKDKNIYGNIHDYENNVNPLLTNIKLTKFEEKYYNNIESNVTEVEYEFMLEGNHIVLKNFNMILE